MKRMAIAALLSLIPVLPAFAQDPHAGHTAPMPPPDANEAVDEAVAKKDEAAGNAAPPAVILDGAADRFYGADAMDLARKGLVAEHGGERVSKVMANILEFGEADRGSGYRWDLEAWYGGDFHRLALKTEGEGLQSDGVSSAEIQALYSRSLGRYTDIQFGVRYDLEPDDRAYATVAVETLFPYWVELEAAAFLSDRGDAFGRLEASHDLRLTQRLILQPRLELELAAQDVPEAGVGSGLSSAELGLRLRYDIRRELAPYIGLNFEKSFGATADFAQAAGEDSDDTSIVVGLRAWF